MEVKKFQQDAEEGNINNIRRAVRKGINVNAVLYKGENTPLMTAADKGHLDVVKFLLSKGADVNATNQHGETALIMAIKYGNDYDVVDVLLENGADPNAHQFEPLQIALEAEDQYVIKKLLQYGANPNVTMDFEYVTCPPIEWFFHNDSPYQKAIVRILLKYGANPNHLIDGKPLLLVAMEERTDNDVIKILLNAGADPNTKVGGKSMLMFTAEMSEDLVELLLEAGANPNIEYRKRRAIDMTDDDDVKEMLLFSEPRFVYARKRFPEKNGRYTTTWMEISNIEGEYGVKELRKIIKEVGLGNFTSKHSRKRQLCYELAKHYDDNYASERYNIKTDARKNLAAAIIQKVLRRNHLLKKMSKISLS
jgi:ankyrin repeat protein